MLEQFVINEISMRIKNFSRCRMFVVKHIAKLIAKACVPISNVHQLDSDGREKNKMAIIVKSVKHDKEFCQI